MLRRIHIITGISLGLLIASFLATQTLAGTLSVIGNQTVSNNLSAQSITLGTDTRTNWPMSANSGVISLTTPLIDFTESALLFSFTLTTNTSWVFTNHVAGRVAWLQIAENGTGGWVNTWPEGLLWPDGVPVNGSTAANSLSVFKILDNGTSWLVQAEGLNYAVHCTNCFALEFDGADNYVSLGSLFGSAPPALTIEMWVKGHAADNPNGALLFSMSDLTTFSQILSVDSSGQLGGYVTTDEGGTPQSGAGLILDGGWHHVAISWDGSTQRLYVDGILEASTDVGGTLLIDNSWIASQGGGSLFKGTIDEVRVSNSARYTTSDFSGILNGLKNLSTDGNTVALWHFNENTGATTADSSGNGHTGMLSGSPLPSWVDGR